MKTSFQYTHLLKHHLFFGLMLLMGLCSTSGHAAESIDDGWIEGKIQSMTLREKLGQMIMIDLKGQDYTPDIAEQLRAGPFGSVILFDRNIKDATQTRLFIHELQTQAIVDTGIPLLVSVDQEGGQVNRLGGVLNSKLAQHNARTLGSAYDFAPQKARPLIFKLTSDIALRIKSLGFNMNLAPVLDLTDDKTSYIYKRSYGGDPLKVSAIAKDYTEAMQKQGIATTGKHFPNLSITKRDSHQEMPTLERTLAELEAHEFVPFRQLKDDLAAIMVGHILIPAIDQQHPASVSKAVIAHLREKIGYQGLIIIDDLKMKALSERYPLYEIVLRSVFADADLLIMAWDKDKQLEALAVLERAVQRKHLSMQRIDRSVRRILAVKSRFARRQSLTILNSMPAESLATFTE